MTESGERYYIPAPVVVLIIRCPLARFGSRELMAVNDS
jgi:hypothetical protein